MDTRIRRGDVKISAGWPSSVMRGSSSTPTADRANKDYRRSCIRLPVLPWQIVGTFYHFVYGDHESGTHFANRWNVFTAIECPLSGSKECASDKFLLT